MNDLVDSAKQRVRLSGWPYAVDWVKVVAPDDLSVLAPSTESALTLVTCDPFYFVGPASKRFVVRARKY